MRGGKAVETPRLPNVGTMGWFGFQRVQCHGVLCTAFAQNGRDRRACRSHRRHGRARRDAPETVSIRSTGQLGGVGDPVASADGSLTVAAAHQAESQTATSITALLTGRRRPDAGGRSPPARVIVGAISEVLHLAPLRTSKYAPRPPLSTLITAGGTRARWRVTMPRGRLSTTAEVPVVPETEWGRPRRAMPGSGSAASSPVRLRPRRRLASRSPARPAAMMTSPVHGRHGRSAAGQPLMPRCGAAAVPELRRLHAGDPATLRRAGLSPIRSAEDEAQPRAQPAPPCRTKVRGDVEDQPMARSGP